MRVSLTRLQVEMLIDAACRMQCDDLWEGTEEGGLYDEKHSDALADAIWKLQAAHGPYKQGDM
jgi:hypothetical protein